MSICMNTGMRDLNKFKPLGICTHIGTWRDQWVQAWHAASHRVCRQSGNLDALGGQLLVLQSQAPNLCGAHRLQDNSRP